MSLDELRAQQARRRALLHLAVACAALLTAIALAACGPSDAGIESSVAVSGETTTTATPKVRIAAIDGPVVFDIPTTLPPTTAAPASRVPPPSAPVTTVPPAPTVSHTPSGSGGRLGDPYYIPTWHALRECEAPDWAGGWQANTGNGYYGGLQFALSSWRAVGGTGYPHEHSADEQIRRGQMLWEMQGWGAWPACSRKLGWR